MIWAEKILNDNMKIIGLYLEGKISISLIKYNIEYIFYTHSPSCINKSELTYYYPTEDEVSMKYNSKFTKISNSIINKLRINVALRDVFGNLVP